MKCHVYQLGQIEYRTCLQLQKYLQQQRIDGTVPDVLLLLEHPPTVTIGKTGRMENILVPARRLHQEGICLVSTDRGGDATYHGPGQLVAYPILSLKSRGQDVRQYVRNLEEAGIRTLKDFGISAGRDEMHPGVWIDMKEIAAIGLSIRNWVTMHGLALNVSPNLSHYNFINPCGFTGRKATSMADLLGRELPVEAVETAFISHFSEIFGAQTRSGNKKELFSRFEQKLQKGSLSSAQ